MGYEAKLLKIIRKQILLIIVLGCLILWGVQWWLNHIPGQPIAFRHDVHAGTMQISCYYCHTGVLHGEMAGVPSIQDCMQCHQIINSQFPSNIPPDFAAEIDKLQVYWQGDKSKNLAQSPVYWHKVYKLPKHVHFSHKAHVNYFLEAAKKDSGLGSLQEKNSNVYPCLLCHGNIAGMQTVVPTGNFAMRFLDGGVNPVTQMGYCVLCHNRYAGKRLPGGPDVPPRNQMIDCTACHH